MSKEREAPDSNFTYGVGFGIIIAYLNIAPLLIGVVVGYTLAKQNHPLVDQFITRASFILMQARKTYVSG